MRFDAKQLTEMSRAVRAHALYAVRCAGSGHVGIVLDAADIITIIYANFLRRGRDKFVLSAGHGSALLYAVLKLAGYNIGDLESFNLYREHLEQQLKLPYRTVCFADEIGSVVSIDEVNSKRPENIAMFCRWLRHFGQFYLYLQFFDHILHIRYHLIKYLLYFESLYF